MNLKQRHRGNIEQPHVRGRAEGGSPKCFSQACCSRCEECVCRPGAAHRDNVCYVWKAFVVIANKKVFSWFWIMTQ